MQFEAHPHSGGHHLLQQVQVSENPLVFGGDAEVALEQGVETEQKRFQTVCEKVKTAVNEGDRPLSVRLRYCK